jgi:hypothetical protein
MTARAELSLPPLEELARAAAYLDHVERLEVLEELEVRRDDAVRCRLLGAACFYSAAMRVLQSTTPEAELSSLVLPR